MKFRELKLLIDCGESETLEFERKISDELKIAKSIVAFSNLFGGKIIIGVDDNGSVFGIESEKNIKEEILRIADKFCFPPVKIEIEIIPVKDKDVVLVDIFESNEKPHYVVLENELIPFIREKSKTIEMDKTLINILKNKNKPIENYYFGDYEKQIFNLLDMKNKITTVEVAEFLNVTNRKASRLLTNLSKLKLLNYKIENQLVWFTLSD